MASGSASPAAPRSASCSASERLGDRGSDPRARREEDQAAHRPPRRWRRRLTGESKLRTLAASWSCVYFR
ncbi:hypothetical protein PAPYR_12974 [Paratrimastix pyriformis]|uniref:Uncharacterized protein n=1 Tax=Paratrimastix pyriformis TaxID=342808 RepID=A0ABQ8U2L1_9EUKA|nr:hypothetical protein PAPYR_12974 [Paratrimastix pyriformis]